MYNFHTSVCVRSYSNSWLRTCVTAARTNTLSLSIVLMVEHTERTDPARYTHSLPYGNVEIIHAIMSLQIYHAERYKFHLEIGTAFQRKCHRPLIGGTELQLIFLNILAFQYDQTSNNNEIFQRNGLNDLAINTYYT